ncbi:hypothetical protein LU699_12710 [Luteimonas fraxinea]|uniref:Benenodin family lasso peptide n=1 Tax=Luteimonas fraxinea TaxID=2901869 RepID=A0ABS8UI03_9GAMM|nr:hypothetical protein [Luteimonas fraxinea]MCD9098125.1 hypothetical protein [Luteimonas fraxinea]MCD9125345.1 hypothetical protein [Luteimonas fraxinea]UHH09150.1 hypothetical protein LU699_12710 [Luteimonas fraxinea]
MKTTEEATRVAGAPSEDEILIGVASVDTKGGALLGEDMGNTTMPGIAED